MAAGLFQYAFLRQWQQYWRYRVCRTGPALQLRRVDSAHLECHFFGHRAFQPWRPISPSCNRPPDR